tara:strand:+ start:2285 stop:2989 length:705 start_codon:yes stop_codon:yes gene_type:complete
LNSLHDNDIHLFEDEHKYQLRSNPSITFNSVTELISKYFEPFNKDSVASKLINTHPKYFGMTKVELIKQWDERRDHGSKIHKEIEDFIKSGKVATEQKSLDAIDWLERNSLEKELQSEAIIFSKELKIAGSIDVLIHDKKNNSYVILDWKTSKSIPKTSFNGKMGIHPATRHLMDCKFIHYSIQLSFYRYILEMYYGLLISDQLIAHLDGNSCTIHRAHYHKNEIMKIISSEKN